MKSLPDVQSYSDSRNLRIKKVGVTEVPWGFSFAPTSSDLGQAQPTIGSLDLFVALPAEKKGTHMSRFVQVLAESERVLSYSKLVELFEKIKVRLAASQVFGTLRFPFLVDRKAPVTGELAQIQLQVSIDVALKVDCEMLVAVSGPATSLCPCSKEISAYGAHNQRCELRAEIKFDSGCEIGIDELFAMLEESASCSVYPILKRADEKAVTEAAYDNPKFVEDTVRDLATRLRADLRIAEFRCSAKNFESIHQHNAYAEIDSKQLD